MATRRRRTRGVGRSKTVLPRRLRRGSQPDGDDPRAWKSLDLIYDQVVDKLERQASNWERLDDRLRFILGVIGIVFAAVLGLRANMGGGGTPIPVPGWVALSAGLSVLLYLIAAAIVARVYRTGTFNRPPNPVTLRNQYLLTDPRRTKLEIIDSINVAYNRNALTIEKKADAFNRAFSVSAVATLFLGLAVIGQVFANADLALLVSVWSNVSAPARGR